MSKVTITIFAWFVEAKVEVDGAVVLGGSEPVSGRGDHLRALREVLIVAEGYGAVDDFEIIDRLHRHQDWRKGAHIEGVILQHDTLGAILEQCQRDNGNLKEKLKRIAEIAGGK